MKIKFNSKIFIMLGWFGVLSLGIANEASVMQSLRWQKIQLEEKLQSKISNSIKSVVDAKDFVVNVEIEVKDPPPLKFDSIDKQDEVKKGIRVSDVKFEESQGDYIAFSKVGLEVPVVEEYFKQEKNDTNLLELEQKKWQYQDYVNKTNDLFLNVKDVKVNIFLSEKLPESTTKTIDTLLKSLEINISGIEPLYAIKRIKLDYDLPIEPPKKLFEGYTPNDYVELASKFNGLIGALLASFLLGLFIFFSISRYISFRKSEKDKKLTLGGALQTDSNSKEDSTSEADGDGGAGGGALTPEEAQRGQLGIDRFQTYIKKNQVEALILIKKWLGSAEKDDKFKQVLTAIGQQVEFEKFEELLSKLSQNERYKWGQLAGNLLSPNELVRANILLNEELIGQIIVPAEIKNSEIVDIILGIEIKDAINLIEDNLEMGAFYIRMINPALSTKILEKLREDEVEALLEKAMNLDMNKYGKDPSKVISFFKKYETGGRILPFANKVFEMFKDISPKRELELFRGLARTGQMNTLKKAISSFFPSNLIFNMPKNLLNEIVKDYPLSAKIELIASLDEDKKDTILALIAPEGSTIRELMDIEFESLEQDKAKMMKIVREADEIYMRFTNYVRQKISSKDAYKSEVQPLIDEFLEQLESLNQAKLHKVA